MSQEGIQGGRQNFAGGHAGRRISHHRRTCREEEITSQEGMQGGHLITGGYTGRRASCHRSTCREEDIMTQEDMQGGHHITGRHAGRISCHWRAYREEEDIMSLEGIQGGGHNVKGGYTVRGTRLHRRVYKEEDSTSQEELHRGHFITG